MKDDTASAAILAGGQAMRFGGRDKSALLVDGRPILDRLIGALAPLTEDLVIVGGVAHPPVAARGGDDRAGNPPTPRVIHDIVPGCGPLGGLHAALSAARGHRVLIVACDMPFLTSPFVAHLLSLAHGADIVVPQSERGYHPLCAVYTTACLAPAAARLADGRLKMRELLDEMRTRVVPLEDIRRFGDPDRLLANVNTPADYADLEALQGHKL
jgi:molybdopterin-guanine dinucleotide biosynthesis protein A